MDLLSVSYLRIQTVVLPDLSYTNRFIAKGIKSSRIKLKASRYQCVREADRCAAVASPTRHCTQLSSTVHGRFLLIRSWQLLLNSSW